MESSYKWTPITCDLWHLASFTSHNVFEVPMSTLKKAGDWARLDN